MLQVLQVLQRPQPQRPKPQRINLNVINLSLNLIYMDMVDMEMVDMDHLAELSKTFGLVQERLPQSPNDRGGFSL